MEKLPGLKQNITKFILDLIILVGFLLGLDPRITGIAIHEWLTIAGTAVIVLHLLLNWNWIEGLTRRFFRRVTVRTRLNYILNWLFFIDGVLVMLTGIMISEVVLPLFGLRVSLHSTWRQLHTLTADLSLFIMAVHLALNWDWVVTVIKRYMVQPITGSRMKKETASKSNEVHS